MRDLSSARLPWPVCKNSCACLWTTFACLHRLIRALSHFRDVQFPLLRLAPESSILHLSACRRSWQLGYLVANFSRTSVIFEVAAERSGKQMEGPPAFASEHRSTCVQQPGRGASGASRRSQVAHAVRTAEVCNDISSCLLAI